MQLPQDEAIVLVSGLAPVRARKLRHYETKTSSAAAPPPRLESGAYADCPRLRAHDWKDQLRQVDLRLATLPFRDLMQSAEEEGGLKQQLPCSTNPRMPSARLLPARNASLKTIPTRPPIATRCSGLQASRQRFAAPMRSRATTTICFQPFDGPNHEPKLSVYLSDHVAKRLTLAANRPGTNKSAIVDAALDRFLNPERDQSGDAALVRRLDRMSRQLGQIEP